MGRRVRVLVGKVGLDGHDVGARVVARALADAGMEVVYTGLRQTPEQLVNAALEEGVDVIGVSILSGSHMALFAEILRLLEEKNARDIHFIAGGVIPTEDIQPLKDMGVAGVFLPETTTRDIIDFVVRLVDDSLKADKDLQQGG